MGIKTGITTGIAPGRRAVRAREFPITCPRGRVGRADRLIHVCAGNTQDQVAAAAFLDVSVGTEAKREGSRGTSEPPLSTYEHHGKWNVGWFSKAVEDIVRRLDGTPSSDQFMHVVRNNEAVILVKKITSRVDLDAHHIPPQVASENKNVMLSLAIKEVEKSHRMETRPPEQQEVEHVCQDLLQSQARMLVNSGRVGDCCDAADLGSLLDDETHVSDKLRAFHGFWGVVVQTKERSSVEGCYLLRAGCSVVESGCSCTHYTLTRVLEPTPVSSPGSDEFVPPVADQFVDSWRRRRGGFGYDIL